MLVLKVVLTILLHSCTESEDDRRVFGAEPKSDHGERQKENPAAFQESRVKSSFESPSGQMKASAHIFFSVQVKRQFLKIYESHQNGHQGNGGSTISPQVSHCEEFQQVHLVHRDQDHVMIIISIMIIIT